MEVIIINDCNKCKHQLLHGGKCNGLRLKRCLKFEKDQRGELFFSSNIEITIGVGKAFPKLNTFKNDYELNGADIMFTKITPIGWNLKGIGVVCKCSGYYFKNNEQEKILSNVVNIRKI